MRIVLEPGIQRKLIKTAKIKSKFTWPKLASAVGLSETQLRASLFHEKHYISENCYNKLCKISEMNFNSKIMKKLDDNWGRSLGGKNSVSKPRVAKLLVNEHSAGLAEIIGIMLGDGNIWSKKGFYYVRVAGHLRDDREYLLNYVRPLFKKIFGIEMQIVEYENHSEMFLQKGSKDLVFTFLKYGLPQGSKIKNKVGIPGWIFNSKDYMRACIRGLIDTDGSVYCITGRPYTYISYRSFNPILRKTFQKAMGILGFKICKWTSKGKSQTYIAKKRLINKYYTEIGFSNPKHLERFKAPVV